MRVLPTKMSVPKTMAYTTSNDNTKSTAVCLEKCPENGLEVKDGLSGHAATDE